jgi:hypothetical protein
MGFSKKKHGTNHSLIQENFNLKSDRSLFLKNPISYDEEYGTMLVDEVTRKESLVGQSHTINSRMDYNTYTSRSNFETFEDNQPSNIATASLGNFY